MRSFEGDVIRRQQLPPQLIQTIGLLGEYKGKQELFKQQAPQALDTLRRDAIIQSTESSNRIEGITAPQARIKALVDEKTRPANRSEQEIAGYRDVLNTIHANATNMPFTPSIVQQLHRDLYGFVPGGGGRWKPTNNDIEQILEDGTKVVRFSPVSAFETPSAMEHLHKAFKAHSGQAEITSLLLIATYVLDFLCIHPFPDGNGRMARLLTPLLLYQAGYEVGRYVSLEMAVERQKQGYYDAFYLSSQGWHEGRHTLIPWWEYFLGVVLLGTYKEFEQRTGTSQNARGAKRAHVLSMFEKLPSTFRFADLVRTCPGVNNKTIQRVLSELKVGGRVECLGSGRGAVWKKLGHFEPKTGT